MTDVIIFTIVNLIDKSNKYKDIYFKIGDELREVNDVTTQPESRIREPSEGDADRRTSTNKQQEHQQQQQQQNDGRRRVSKKPPISFRIIMLLK